jgi:hypothetical protein
VPGREAQGRGGVQTAQVREGARFVLAVSSVAPFGPPLSVPLRCASEGIRL